MPRICTKCSILVNSFYLLNEYSCSSAYFSNIHQIPIILGGASGKEPICQCRRPRRRGFSPWVEKIPWRRKWQLTPGFLSGQSHGQRSLVGYRPRGCKESGMTKVTYSIAHYHPQCTDDEAETQKSKVTWPGYQLSGEIGIQTQILGVWS